MPRSRQGVVVTLEYLSNQTPRVARRGSNETASEILRDARRYGIPIVTDANLSNALESVSMQEEIPEELYGPVAEYLVALKLI